MATNLTSTQLQQAMDAAAMQSLSNVKMGITTAAKPYGDYGIGTPAWSSGFNQNTYTSPNTAVTQDAALVMKLQGENARLMAEVENLKRALANPDLPLARSVRELLDNMQPKDIIGRTVPPFNEAVLSDRIVSHKRPISEGTYRISIRSGKYTNVRVVGLIVREEPIGVMADIGDVRVAQPSTYMVPTERMTEGDALEAIADLCADIIMRRVFKKMGEDK